MEHRIIQYSLSGQLIKVWDNTNQAANESTDSATIIIKQLKGIPTKKRPNSQWRYYSENFPNIIDPYSKENKMTWARNNDTILELDRAGNIIATYNGTAEAAKASGFSQSYICNVIKGKIRHPRRKFIRQ